MPLDPTTIRPDIPQVAALIRNRTRRPGGQEVGTFDTTTRPTASEVGPLIDRAARHVSISVGERFEDWSTGLLETAKDAAASFAALYIEQSYYGDGSSPDAGPADQLGRIARETLAALLRDGGRGRLLRSVQMTDEDDPRRVVFDPNNPDA
jgi:hypothetical protein